MTQHTAKTKFPAKTLHSASLAAQSAAQRSHADSQIGPYLILSRVMDRTKVNACEDYILRPLSRSLLRICVPYTPLDEFDFSALDALCSCDVTCLIGRGPFQYSWTVGSRRSGSELYPCRLGSEVSSRMKQERSNTKFGIFKKHWHLRHQPELWHWSIIYALLVSNQLPGEWVVWDLFSSFIHGFGVNSIVLPYSQVSSESFRVLHSL